MHCHTNLSKKHDVREKRQVQKTTFWRVLFLCYKPMVTKWKSGGCIESIYCKATEMNIFGDGKVLLHNFGGDYITA